MDCPNCFQLFVAGIISGLFLGIATMVILLSRYEANTPSDDYYNEYDYDEETDR